MSDLIASDGTLLSDNPGKAELLADRFYDVHRAGGDMRATSFGESVSREVLVLADHLPSFDFGHEIMADGTCINGTSRSTDIGLVTPDEMGSALRARANKKSSGNDGIPDYVLRKTNHIAWRFLAILINHCLNIGYFPEKWKEGLVVPILKPRSDPKQVSNYRPISLLSAFGKLMEWFILSKIRDKIIDGGVLSDCQFGFRNGHSTSHALMVFADYVARGLNRRCPTLAVSLDFAKAFDTAWQEGIVYKMIGLGFDHSTCRLIGNFLRDRTFRVKVGDERSSVRTIMAGVPQGSLLGPVLYNILLSDIPQPPDGDLLLIYADDILVAANGPRASALNRRVNSYLEILRCYFVKWGLRLNIDKTDGVMIKGRRGRLYPNARRYIPHVVIDGRTVRTSDRMRYLGVTFHENFEFYRHVDRVLERVKGVYHMYNRLLRRREGLSTAIRLLIYRQIIRPLMSYAFPVWFGISSHQMERLRIWERRILSACLGLRPTIGPDGSIRRPSCRSIYDGVDFQRVDVFLIGSALGFLERSTSLDNALVTNCFTRASDLETLHGNSYFSPVDLLALREGGLLYGDAGLLFYHRRVNTLDITNLVYNTIQ